MLQHIPEWLGHALSGVRAGAEKVAIADPALSRFEKLELSSPAFADGGRLPDRFTADGAGISPPLTWRDPPVGTAHLALLVEDADSPTPQPLVHAVVWGMPPEAGSLAEGAMAADGDGTEGGDVGRNSYLREGWLPPDPPTGHGEHRYVFQLFALGAGAQVTAGSPGRGALLEAIGGHVLAAGVLIGTYSRGEPAAIGPVGAVAAA
ncbi:YbhB/YbcL family Raf kinase inhibitor-like protein [Sphingomonas rubra]|uniref:Phospholipid-binding protein, PBP family n=1 Tax=Sphingomonas rubra TaxID=634430 RepID=A0A1I5TX36_9SPHN|nr:YbhB/YbcL family Raf kinase inhibitor-like protein [Sphingomonas rubra]SFP87167.1 hypothetical protein SAMN04488241_10999 [Sphingomonas rubra]